MCCYLKTKMMVMEGWPAAVVFSHVFVFPSSSLVFLFVPFLSFFFSSSWCFLLFVSVCLMLFYHVFVPSSVCVCVPSGLLF